MTLYISSFYKNIQKEFHTRDEKKSRLVKTYEYFDKARKSQQHADFANSPSTRRPSQISQREPQIRKIGRELNQMAISLDTGKRWVYFNFFLFEFINLLSGGRFRINSKQSSLSDKPSRDSVTDTSDPSYFIGDSKTGLQPAPTDMSPPSITPETLRAVRQKPLEIDHWCAMPRPMIGSSRQTTRVIRTSTKSSRQRQRAGHRGNIDAIRSRWRVRKARVKRAQRYDQPKISARF